MPPDPPAKPRMTAEDRRARQADRIATIRLRMAIGHELDARGITTSAEISKAFGMPANDAVNLMTRRQWRESTVAQLEAVAARLGLTLPDQS